MSATGTVRCTCYEDGLTSPPPVPVRVDERDRIVAVDRDDHKAVWDWHQDACAHPCMDAAEVTLGWAWLRSFRYGLEEAGAERFHVILANLPEYYDACTAYSPEQSAAALGELRSFVASFDGVDEDRLVTVDGADVRWRAVRGHPEWWQTAAPGLAGLTGRGTLAVWPGTDLGVRPLFEAARVGQRVLHRDDGRPCPVELTDLDSGATHRLAHGISVDGDYPERLEVHTRSVSVHGAYPQVEMFEDLFLASVRTGHYVDWC